MIIDGRAAAEDLYVQLAAQRAKIARKVVLGIVVVGENPVIESFVGMKVRAAARLDVEMVRASLPETATTQEVVQAARGLVEKSDAVIMQLPLPKQVDIEASLSAIPKDHDVDATNPDIAEDDRLVFAPVALAVVELLNRGNVGISGARTVVVGGGRLVGKPAAALLKRLGAEVSMFTLEEGSIDDLKDADILVLGTGNPGFIKPEHIKEGVALVDAGTAEMNKKIQGDADPACAEKCSVFTPVPGGVGPVAVSMIFKNLFDLIELRT
jgi:methylenetetrahydrofolate dehydrogenase (NADP+)/methenyltetrahydrofolate cyclohydrolase